MSYDYSTIVLTAYNSIKEYGTLCTVVVTSNATYSPTTDTFASTATNYSTYCLFVNYGEENYGYSAVPISNNNTLVKMNNKKMDIPAYGLPRIDQIKQSVSVDVHVSGEIFRMIDCSSVSPGGTAILYKLETKPR